jgi:hypothetical protein
MQRANLPPARTCSQPDQAAIGNRMSSALAIVSRTASSVALMHASDCAYMPLLAASARSS